MSAELKAKFRIPLDIIKNEYQFYKSDGLFDDWEKFRQYIIRQTYTILDATPSNQDRKTIKYNHLYRNNSKVYGIFEKDKSKLSWTLTKFVTQSQITKNKKRKKYKQSKRRVKVKKCGLSYDPKEYEKSITQIKKEMTQNIIPNQVNEININDIYHYMIKSISLSQNITTNDGKMRVFNLQFTDKNTAKRLYCVADKVVDKSSSYKWTLQNKLYTAEQIIELTKLTENKLPITIRDTDDFKQKLNDIVTMEKMLNNPEIRANIFNTKIPWQNITVFTNDREANKTEHKITKPKDIFVDEVKRILHAQNRDIALIPILLFNHNSDKNNYTVHGLMRLHIEENDIGISFEYKNRMILPGAVHLNQSWIEAMHHLATPNACQHAFFDGWKTQINGFFIGDKDYYLNQFRSKSIECQKKTDILFDMVSILGQLNINHQMLTRTIKKAKAVMPSLDSDNINKDFILNDDIKCDDSGLENIYGTMFFFPNMGAHIGTPVVTSGMMVSAKSVHTNVMPTHNNQPTEHQSTASVQSSTLNVNADEYVPNSNKLSTIEENTEISNCVSI
eukprot:278924_1